MRIGRSPHTEAVVAASKLLYRGTASETAVLRSLKRRCPGLGAKAAPLLSSATELLAEALLIIEQQLPSLFAIYEKRGQVGPADVAAYASSLARQFPSWPNPSVEAALWSAAVYKLR